MGTSCCRCYCLFESRNWEISEGNIKEFEYPTISDEDYLDVENKIQETTGFEPYKSMNIKLNKKIHKIEGTYYQYNKGCILYALLNNGYIDEKYIPASMKYYKDHSHREDKKNDQDFLRRIMSVIDLSHLWINIGGECPFLEIGLKEAKKRIYYVLKDYFNNPNTEIMKKVAEMTWQTKDYFELLGKVKIKYTPLNDILEIKEDACIKEAIDKNIIKKRDIIKYGRHCFIFDDVLEKDSKKIYSFQDSLAYFRQATKDKNYNNCDFSKKGYIFAQDDAKFIKINNPNEIEIGIVEILT